MTSDNKNPIKKKNIKKDETFKETNKNNSFRFYKTSNKTE